MALLVAWVVLLVAIATTKVRLNVNVLNVCWLELMSVANSLDDNENSVTCDFIFWELCACLEPVWHCTLIKANKTKVASVIRHEHRSWLRYIACWWQRLYCCTSVNLHGFRKKCKISHPSHIFFCQLPALRPKWAKWLLMFASTDWFPSA